MRRLIAIAGTAGLLAVGLIVPPAMAAAPSAPAYTCTGGEFPENMVHIPSGTYASITVAGACDVLPGGVYNIVGNLNVLAGAVFDAQSVPSTITVGRNVTAAAGSLLGLGCQPNFPGPPGVGKSGHPCLEPYEDDSSTITVNGNVTATDANTVLLNGITVQGNVTLTGGGGDIPWSVKNNTIGRNLTVSELTPFWFGALFNNIDGNATLTNITVTEDYPGASQSVYIVRNEIGRNLTCTGLGPNLSFGFFPGANTVGHNANGQCAEPFTP